MPLYLQAPQGMLAASLKHPIDCAEQATPVTASESRIGWRSRQTFLMEQVMTRLASFGLVSALACASFGALAQSNSSERAGYGRPRFF